MNQLRPWMDRVEHLRTENARLEAEIARLRAALNRANEPVGPSAPLSPWKPKRMSAKVDKCHGCEKNDSPGLHSCPYQCDINDNCVDDYCNCCDDCQHECAMDV
jgi:hypothetical protein